MDRSDNPTDKLRLATTRIVIGAGSLVAVVWLAAAASPLFGVLVISALLAYVLYPLVRLLERRTRLNHTQSKSTPTSWQISAANSSPNSSRPNAQKPKNNNFQFPILNFGCHATTFLL